MLHEFTDNKLSHLHTVLDPQAMSTHFEAHFRNAAGMAVEKCAIEKVYYRPGRRCNVLYRLTFRHGTNGQAEQWFFGSVFPSGSANNRFQDAVAKLNGASKLNDFARPPVSLHDDLDMVLWTFPNDANMPGLALMLDADFVKNEIENSLAEFGYSPAWRVENLSFDRVKYMPGKRCVLRFQVTLVGSGGDSRTARFYSKTYHDAKSRYHFESLQKAYQHLTTSSARVRIPRPIRHLAVANTIWQEEWPGQPLLDEIENFEWKYLFQRIAAAVADVHKSNMRHLRRGPDLDEALKTALDDGAELVDLVPELRPSLLPLFDCLVNVKKSFAHETLPSAPIHGAIRLEQMLTCEDEIALVDFDALALGDPLFDVAELIASLQFLELRDGVSRSRLEAATIWFLESYAAQVPWSCDRRRLAWYAMAFLISKMFLAVKNLDRQAFQKLDSTGIALCQNWRRMLD